MARKTIATLEAELAAKEAEVEKLRATVDAVVANVTEYDGCYEGKREFLRECGIDTPGQNPTLFLTVVLNIEDDVTVDSVIEAIHEAIDDDFSAENSAYVFDGRWGVEGEDAHEVGKLYYELPSKLRDSDPRLGDRPTWVLSDK